LGLIGFILRDVKKYWYIWDAWDAELMRLSEVWIRDKRMGEQKVENILP
jgi:hypothetical protein